MKNEKFLENRWNNLSEITPTEIEKFVDIYNKGNHLLIEMEKFAAENKVPILLPSSAKLLQLICRLKQPKTILELGTGIGYSTLNMLLAVNGKCNLTSVDFNADRIEIARSFIKKSDFKTDFICNDIFETITELICNERKFDLIFADSMKSEYPFFNYKIQTLLNNNGIAIFDNVLFRGYICDNYPKKYKRSVKLLKKFLDDIKTYPSFDISLLPVGDGLLVIKQEI